MEQILYADFTKSNLEDGSLGDIQAHILRFIPKTRVWVFFHLCMSSGISWMFLTDDGVGRCLLWLFCWSLQHLDHWKYSLCGPPDAFTCIWQNCDAIFNYYSKNTFIPGSCQLSECTCVFVSFFSTAYSKVNLNKTLNTYRHITIQSEPWEWLLITKAVSWILHELQLHFM